MRPRTRPARHACQAAARQLMPPSAPLLCSTNMLPCCASDAAMRHSLAGTRRERPPSADGQAQPGSAGAPHSRRPGAAPCRRTPRRTGRAACRPRCRGSTPGSPQSPCRSWRPARGGHGTPRRGIWMSTACTPARRPPAPQSLSHCTLGRAITLGDASVRNLPVQVGRAAEVSAGVQAAARGAPRQ